MLRTICRGAAAALITLCLASAAAAQSAERVYTNGSVWTIGYAETKPGHFDDYLENLYNVWKRYLDAQKADGDVLSYKVISIAYPRDGEPDLMLMVEYRNWAAFDRGTEYFDKLAARLQGSVDNARQANIDREALRKLRGGLVGQELVFKN